MKHLKRYESFWPRRGLEWQDKSFKKKINLHHYGPNFRGGDYVKYIGDPILTHDGITYNLNDLFFIVQDLHHYDGYTYKLGLIDNNFDIISIDSLVPEDGLVKYTPTEEELNNIEIKLSIDKYNL